MGDVSALSKRRVESENAALYRWVAKKRSQVRNIRQVIVRHVKGMVIMDGRKKDEGQIITLTTMLLLLLSSHWHCQCSSAIMLTLSLLSHWHARHVIDNTGSFRLMSWLVVVVFSVSCCTVLYCWILELAWYHACKNRSAKALRIFLD